MAVKVKVKRPVPVKVPPASFRHPGERKALQQARIMALVAVVVVLLILAATPWRLQLVIATLAWLVLAFMIFPGSAASKQHKALYKARSVEQGPDAEHMVAFLAKQAATLGMATPPLLLDERADSPYLLGKTIVVPANLRQSLDDPELWATLAIMLGHLHAGHAPTMTLLRTAAAESSPILRPVLLPVRVWAMLLGAWSQYAEMTADRVAMLLTRDRKVVSSAVLKGAVRGSEEGISQEEISSYLARAGGMQAEGSDVTTHYRLGEFLRARPWVTSRLKAIGAYATSEDFKRDLERLAQASAGR